MWYIRSMGMLMNKNRTRCGGFLWAEMVVAIGLLGVVLTGLAVSLRGFALINDCQWARQRCTAAAQAQIDSLVAAGRPIEREELQRLWPRVEVRVDRSPGAGPWGGLELLQVTAATQAGRRQIKVHLARYLGRPSPLAVRSVPARAPGEMSDGVTTNEVKGGQS